MANNFLRRLGRFFVDINPIEREPQKTKDVDIDSMINDLGLKVVCTDKDLDLIPATGAFVTVSNHPFGGIDGLLLLSVLLSRRPDTKIFATNLINKIDALRPYAIPFEGNGRDSYRTASMSQFRAAYRHLSHGSPVCIFPAGDVSTYNTELRTITDKRWGTNFVRFAKNADVPVVPIHIGGSNGNLFHLVRAMHPVLGTAAELLSRGKREIELRIGTPVKPAEAAAFEGIEKYGRYLRAKTYALDNQLDVRKFFTTRYRTDSVPETIPDAIPSETLAAEVDSIRKECTLFRSGDMSVFCAKSELIPNILKELGRLREITFRAVGEGTNNAIDIDEFDLYYNHLFIWDEVGKAIVGAYRVGPGRDITRLYGIDGFYLSTLFKIDEKMLPVLEESFELGRSFIVQEYQRKPLSLFMLWKGILYLLLKHPDYRYLLGPVSISNQFSKFSKDLIINFLKEYHYDDEMAAHVLPRTRFKPNLKFDTGIMLEKSRDDMNKIDKIISDLEPENYRLPVLLKKYLKLNAKIIGFNIDPKFNNSLDGFIVLDLFEVPYSTIESLSKEIDDDSILARFKNEEVQA